MHAWASNDVDITVMEVLDTLLKGIVQKEASMFVCMSPFLAVCERLFVVI